VTSSQVEILAQAISVQIPNVQPWSLMQLEGRNYWRSVARTCLEEGGREHTLWLASVRDERREKKRS